jgi:hypothetical protein
MPKLNHKNYHTPKNTYLTTSKILAYLKDPLYYYERFVLHTRAEEESDALIVGSAVDTFIMYGKKKFDKLFKPVARRTKNESLKYTELTQSQYEEVVGIATKVLNTTAYRELDKFERQVILTSGNCAGMLDFLKVDEKEKTAVIVDLKTSKTVNANKYFYHCLEYGYFYQAAMYRKLVRENFGNIKEILFYHLTVEKDNLGIYKTQTFKFADGIIDEYTIKLNSILKEISERKDWKQQDTTFLEPIELGEAPKVESITEEGWERV